MLEMAKDHTILHLCLAAYAREIQLLEDSNSRTHMIYW